MITLVVMLSGMALRITEPVPYHQWQILRSLGLIFIVVYLNRLLPLGGAGACKNGVAEKNQAQCKNHYWQSLLTTSTLAAIKDPKC